MSRQQDAKNSWLGIRDSLSQSLKQVDRGPEVSTDWAGLCWTLAVGKEIAAVSHVNKITPKTLYVEVAGTEWMPALEALRKKIIEEIRQQAGFDALTQIIFNAAPASDSGGNQPRVFRKNNTQSYSNPGAVQGSTRRSKKRK